MASSTFALCIMSAITIAEWEARQIIVLLAHLQAAPVCIYVCNAFRIVWPLWLLLFINNFEQHVLLC